MISPEVFADQFYMTVAFECRVPESELKISFRPYWNEAGEKAISLAGNGVIDPRSLVSFVQNSEGKYVTHIKSIKKKCVLGINSYEVDIAPLMAPQFHPEGTCATRIGAVVNVRLKGKRIVREGIDACTETGLVTTDILVATHKNVAYRKIPAEDFYAD